MFSVKNTKLYKWLWKKKCIYDGNICKEEYITCEERPETSPSDCDGNMPLNEAQDD